MGRNYQLMADNRWAEKETKFLSKVALCRWLGSIRKDKKRT